MSWSHCFTARCVPRARCLAGRFPCIAYCILACAFASSAQAFEVLGAELGQVQGPGWRAEGVRAAVRLEGGTSLGARLDIARVLLPQPLGEAKDLALACAPVTLVAGELVCREGTLTATHSLLGAEPARVAFRYALTGGALSLRVEALPLAGGHLEASLALGPEGWRLEARGEGLALADLATQAPAEGPLPTAGSLGLDLTARGGAGPGAALQANLQARVQGLAVAAPEPGLEARRLAARVEVEARHEGDAWHGRVHLSADGGEAYVEPLYLDLGEWPLDVTFDVDFEGRRLSVEGLRLERGVVVEGALVADLGDAGSAPAGQGLGGARIVEARVGLAEADLGRLYALYLRPALIGSGLEHLAAGGSVDLAARYAAAEGLRVETRLQGVDLRDRKGRFALSGLTGELAWQDSGPAGGRLAWQGGSLYRIPLGAAALNLATDGYGLRLAEPLRLPVLDGTLRVDELVVHDLRSPEGGFGLSAALSPVSLDPLMRALDLRPLPGKVSALIGGLRYRDGVLGVEGDVLLRPLGGEIVARDLRLERPFGVAPVLTTRLDIRGLDLAGLAEAFGLSGLAATADGRVSELRLEAWQPAALAAELSLRQGKDRALRVSGRANPQGWRADLDGGGLDLAGLALPLGDGLSVSGGRARLAGRLAGHFVQGRGRLDRVDLSAELQGLSFSDPEGRLAGEGVGGRLAFDLRRHRGPLDGTWQANLDRGEALVEPLYLDLAGSPLAFASELSLEGERLALAGIRASHHDRLALTGALTLDLEKDAVSAADVRVRGEVPALYESYAHPFLIGGALGELETAGRLDLRVRLDETHGLAVRGGLEDVYMDDRKGRFGLADVDLALDWQARGGPGASQLTWEGGHFYKVPFGTTRLAVRTQGYRLSLLDPFRVPVLGGALIADSFELDDLRDPRAGWRLDAVIAPLSLGRLTDAFGWPELSGKLSGRIPDVEYRDDTLTVGGTLLVKVFDGRILVQHLRLETPLGPLPVLGADLSLDNLDLERLTEAFSFGRITGRLDGEVAGLRLERWVAAAFDARFFTPPDDHSRHRISQRAVDNLTSLGQGAAGALSRSFLRFFEDFSYRRLGLRCRLQDELCAMGGVAPASKGGYYIVQGSGLPRIDVIGYTHRVDWPTLLERLQRITRQAGEGPVPD